MLLLVCYVFSDGAFIKPHRRYIIPFCPEVPVFVFAKDIEQIANNCFSRLKAEHFFKGYNFGAFCDAIVDFYCVTNMLHPFREGNGRTQRTFISQLIRHSGYDIDFSAIDSDELMIATIQSANGVRDNLLNLFWQKLSER